MEHVEIHQGTFGSVFRPGRLSILRITLFILLILPHPLHASPGDLDPSFGSGGTVISDFGGFSANSLALQPDGKIVVAGSFGFDFALARYNADGRLDAGFGSGGKVTTDFGDWDGAHAVAIQADGKIVVAGSSGFFVHTDIAMARYNPDGSLDPTFGSGGKVTTVFGTSSNAHALALQADGKIVIRGVVEFAPPPTVPPTLCFGPCSGPSFPALLRYNPDGSLDPTFGSGGKVTTEFVGVAGAGPASLALQPDGKIVAAGVGADPSRHFFALARYNPDGRLDGTFGSGGKVTTDFGGEDGAYAVGIQADGKIVVAGLSQPGGGGRNFALARYNPDGHLDGTFGTGGKVTTDFGGLDMATSLALQPDGKIVAAGSSTVVGGSNFALARYNPDGHLDGTFGSGGKVTTDFGDWDRAHAVAIQADGKIVVVGKTGGIYTTDSALARYQGGRPTAAASVGRGGGGDALIFPLIETTNLDTLLAIENGTNRTALHKVRFRDAATGASVLEFELCLTPFSTWTAGVFLEGTVTRVTSTSTLLVNGSATPLNTTLTGNPTRAYLEVIGLRATTSPSSDTAICTDPSIGGDVENAALTGKAYYVKGDGSLPLVYGANAVALNNFAAATIADGTVFGNDVVAQALIGQSSQDPGNQSRFFRTRYFVPASFGGVTQVVLSFPTGPNSVGCPNCRVPSTLVIQAATEAGILLPTITLPSDITLVRVISLSSSDIANDSGLLQVREIASTPFPAVGFGINTTTAGAPLFFNALFPITID